MGFEELIKHQDELRVNIQKCITNIKKAPLERRTSEFVTTKIKELDDLWTQFNKNDNVIRNVPGLDITHPYFEKDVHKVLGSRYSECREDLEQQSLAFKSVKAAPRTQERLEAARTNQKLRGLVEKQRKIILSTQTSIKAALNDIGQNVHSPRYYANLANNIEQHWHIAQELHSKIWSSLDSGDSSEYDYDEFIAIEQDINANIWQLQELAHTDDPQNTSTKPAPTFEQKQTSSLNLPKIELPKFDGNYSKWRQFHDLFTELVDKQSIPQCQKMWLLKSSLSDEAARLIQHFTASAVNYEAAWKVINERYENPRMLINATLRRLLTQSTSNAESAASIKLLHDTTMECVLSLQNLGVTTENWDPILLYILTQYLSKSTHALWEQSLSQPKEMPSLNAFLSFLNLRFQSLEALGARASKEASDQGRNKSYQALSVSISTDQRCIICKQNHLLFRCQEFLKMTPKQRLNAVQRAKRCVNCFRNGHNATSCSSGTCLKCQKKHNTLLHLEGFGRVFSTSSSKSSQNLVSKSAQNNNSTKALSAQDVPASLAALRDHSTNTMKTLLSTISLTISDKWGKQIPCRALLDNGSQANFITKRLVKLLGLQKNPCLIGIEGIGKTQNQTAERVNIQISSNNFKLKKRIEAHILTEIVSRQPSCNIDVTNWNIPDNLQLADPNFHEAGSIDLLIGAGLYFSTISNGKISLGDGRPILQNTLFGWIIGGEYNQNLSTRAITCGVCTEDESLNKTLENFWKLEECDARASKLTTAERRCENHFISNLRRHQDGRFIVKLPFQNDPNQLGESRDIALQRFKAIERKMNKDPDYKSQYVSFMREYEQLGHMEEISSNEIKDAHYFLPHHAVLKPDSSTTKLRVVFDASAKSSSKVSLNDLLATGPTIQDDVFTILLRFRIHRYVFTADIEKMYRQIWIDKDDQKYQLIWWRECPSQPIKCFRLTTVTYGTTSAPYLAIRSLQALAEGQAITFPLAAEVIKRNFYVDDVLSGSDKLSTTIEIQHQLRQLLGSTGFNLRKWCANHPKLLENIPVADQEVKLCFETPGNESIKTMGLTWGPKMDEFKINITQPSTQTITKRSALSDISRIFDPLGFIAPVTANAKIFLQNLWKLKLDWDVSLPRDMHNTWQKFRNDFKLLENINIPRHIFGHKLITDPQVHIFADASEQAYGAVAYIRSIDEHKTVIVRLLCARSRVAPTKQITLPRLELCAAKLAVDLMQKLQEIDYFKKTAFFLWSDSTAVLGWINAESSHYHTFIANRISAIQQISSPQQWRHVRSEDNPADLISRGLSPDKLVNNNFWFYGPIFLHGAVTSWPLQPPREECSLEIRTSKVISAAVGFTTSNLIEGVNHKNSFRRLQRIVAYVFRFIQNSRTPRETRPTHKSPSSDELEAALFIIVRTIQASSFNQELKQLRKHHEVEKSSSICSLSPFIDDTGILRVGGRLEASALPYDSKHPMLIPYNDPLSKLFFIMVHEENKHCGPQALLGTVRQRFWPIKGKSTARSIVQHCIRCNKARPQLLQQMMGSLPATRVTPARPFINTGVDYAGPLWVHYKIRGKRPTKAYLAVFCCFASKAVHLELVTELSTDAFIGALKRFISRRGRCQNLYSDNATNFIGAKNQLAELSSAIHSSSAQNQIISACSTKGIQFHFIPPRSPHFGGLWEAAVKSAKHLLLRSVASASLTYEELETVIVEIEAILNSRPLTSMSSDPSDLTALTPGHFLIGEALTAQVDSRAESTKLSLLSRWKLVSQIKHDFWRRWSNEYLSELQQRQKWTRQTDNVKPGELVIIKEDNIPVMRWPLGRIVKIYHGPDGAVRVADVKTAMGTYKRAIHRLARLPIITDTGTESREEVTTRKRKDDTREEATRRTKMSRHYTLMTLLAILLMMPIILCEPIKITKFDPNAGIHFEHIGSSKIITNEWKLVVYYDLKPLRTEIQLLKNGTLAMNHMCEQIKPTTLCDELVTQFQHTNMELDLNRNLLVSHRQKRGALNFVGNIANSLFGVLDAEYASKMSETITAINDNEQHLTSMLKNQISVIDSTINIMKRDQITAQRSFERLEGRLKDFGNQIHQEADREHTFQMFLSLGLQLSIMTSNIQRVQTALINVLTNVHHGQISPQLLSPEQLNSEILKITAHLSPTMQIPDYQGDLLSIYKLMKVKAAITEKHAIFQITVPLTSLKQFNLYRLIPIPTKINNTMIAIKLSTTVLAINVHRDQYFPTTMEKLQDCFRREKELYLCANSQPIYNKGSEVCACEVSLFNNETRSHCKLEHREDHVWTQANDRNQWIYALATPIQITAVCDNQVSRISLEGAGFIELTAGCVLKYQLLSITSNPVLSSSTHTSYTAFGHIIDVNTTKPSSFPILNTTEIVYEPTLKELSRLQEILETHEFNDLPNRLQTHQYHVLQSVIRRWV